MPSSDLHITTQSLYDLSRWSNWQSATPNLLMRLFLPITEDHPLDPRLRSSYHQQSLALLTRALLLNPRLSDANRTRIAIRYSFEIVQRVPSESLAFPESPFCAACCAQISGCNVGIRHQPTCGACRRYAPDYVVPALNDAEDWIWCSKNAVDASIGVKETMP